MSEPPSQSPGAPKNGPPNRSPGAARNGPASRVLRVGLTGNIAAGKSTVAGWLEEAGCFVVELDAIGHRCLEPGEPAHADVVAEFGSEMLRADGTVDRAALAEVVFENERARRRLEEILHPRIRAAAEERIETWARGAGSGIAVTVAALLFETGSAADYDRMVVVVAPDGERLRRLVDRGLDESSARRRMRAQMDQEEKARRADYVIDNGGSLEETREKVERLVESLRADLKEMRPAGHGRPPAC